MQLTFKKIYLTLSSGGGENYDVFDGGMCSRGDMGSVKALMHVLEVGGETEVGGWVEDIVRPLCALGIVKCGH
jgi:hypothetical protein